MTEMFPLGALPLDASGGVQLGGGRVGGLSLHPVRLWVIRPLAVKGRPHDEQTGTLCRMIVS